MIYLQLFAERREPPTPKRLQEARERGDVFQSPEVVNIFFFLLLVTLGPFTLSSIGQKLSLVMKHSLNITPTSDPLPAFLHALIETGLVTLPLFMAMMVVGVIASVVQVGFLFAPRLHFQRLNVLQGVARMWHWQSLWEASKGLLKVMLILVLALPIMQGLWHKLPYIELTSPKKVPLLVLQEMVALWYRWLPVILVLAAIDYVLSKRRYLARLRMSKSEVKQEQRQLEASPEVRRKMRERQRRLATGRMLQAVPTASVIVTNPTHVAVALRYASTDRAPVVVAKGLDDVALRIRSLAKEHGIKMIENPPVARNLYRVVEIGDPIPEVLYQAVAEIIAMVYEVAERG